MPQKSPPGCFWNDCGKYINSTLESTEGALSLDSNACYL